MLLQALAGAEMAMRDLGIPIDAGSGVAAAEEYYRQTATLTPLAKGEDVAKRAGGK